MNLAINLTRACTRKCDFCYLPFGAQSLDVSLIWDAVTKLHPSSVTLTGGEPLLHKDIKAILSGLLEEGIHTHLLTNGDLLEQRGALLRASRPDMFVSLSTVDLPLIRQLQSLHEASIRIFLHVLLDDNSLTCIDDICQKVPYANAIYLLYPTTSPHNELAMMTPSAWFPLLFEARDAVERHGIPVRFEQAFTQSGESPCPTGRDVFLDVDGRTYACCLLVNYHEGSHELDPIPMDAERCPFLLEHPGEEGFRRICPIALTNEVDGLHLFPSDLP